MAAILPWFRRSKQQLGVKEVVDLAITTGEHVERRPLVSFLILALVVVIIGVACGR